MWRKRVADGRSSGETAAVYSARHGFTTSSLRYWSSGFAVTGVLKVKCCTAAVVGAVVYSQRCDGAITSSTSHDDPIGIQGVGNGGPFAQELGIGGDGET